VPDWLVKCRWKKIAWACVASIKFASKIRARGAAAIIMQNTIKMYLARRVHMPRYLGIKELKKVVAQIDSMKTTVDKMPKNKEKMMAAIDAITAELQANIAKVRQDPNITREAIKKMDADMQKKIDKQLAAIKKEQEKQRLAEEAERLRKLAEEMERERKRKEKEEADRIAAAEEAARRKQMEEEARIAAEKEEARLEKERIQQEKDASNAKLQKKNKETLRAEQEEAALLEQERRDQELAMRLAMDSSSGGLSDEAKAAAAAGGAKRKARKASASHSFSNKKQEALHKKHDLSKWKYADLRDTINTSVDVDLLEACREEFHRRLKVYHAWKLKNSNKNKAASQARAPSALQASAAGRGAAPPPPKAKKKTTTRPQRYFRIPFVRPGEGNAGSKKGWWFAHFDGQWIARQMELHPEKPAVILVAGKHDMEMCELSLDETGLTRKRGAEILPREFDAEWSKCGGPEYKIAT